MYKQACTLLMVLGLCLFESTSGYGRQEPRTARPTPADYNAIIREFARKESAFRKVWQSYTYTQKIIFQVLDMDTGKVREHKEMVIDVYFTTDGERKNRVLREWGALHAVGITREDFQDAIERQPFVLTTENLPKYEIRFLQREHVDELDTYVFDVKPKRVAKGERYFEGRIWVDDQDLQIVMSRGKIVPDYSANKFPEFETRREQIDGEYWFPTWTDADDVLKFSWRNKVRIHERITYEDFKKFEVKTKITFPTAPQAPSSDPKPPRQLR